MKTFLLFIVAFFILTGAQAQTKSLHPLSDADLILGKVRQVKEISYPEPKPGEAIDTLEKRVVWYDGTGGTEDMDRIKHTAAGWVSDADNYTIRLKRFGDPPITTGRDGMDFRIQYDYKGNEIQRDNYTANGLVYSKMLFYYTDGVRTKSEMYINNELTWTISYIYEKDRLIKEHITFPNKSTFYISYKYEGADQYNNWLKRTRIASNATKDDRPQVTERKVIYYP